MKESSILEVSTTSLAEFTRLGKQPRTYVVAPYSRPFVQAFWVHLRYTHFAPGSPREGEFYLVNGIKFAETWWMVISLPRRDWDKASAAARQFGLKLADGIPYLLIGDGPVAAMVNGRNVEREWKGDCEAFPLNGKDVFTIEFDRTTATGALLATTDPKVLNETEATAIVAILRKAGLGDDGIDKAVKDITFWSPPEPSGVGLAFATAEDFTSPPPSPVAPVERTRELPPLDVDQLLEFAVDIARKLLVSEGEGGIRKHVHLYGDPGPCVFAEFPEEIFDGVKAHDPEIGRYSIPDFSESKDAFAWGVKRFADLLNARASVFVSEIWMLRQRAENVNDAAYAPYLEGDRSIEGHPESESSVAIVIELPGHNYTLTSLPIIKTPSGPALGLSETKSSTKDGFKIGGRFTSILRVNR